MRKVNKDRAMWKCKSSEKNLNKDFVLKYKEYLDMKMVSRYSHFSTEDFKSIELVKAIDWNIHILYQDPDPEVVWNNSRLVDWRRLSYSPLVTEYIMDQYGSFLDWNLITARHRFSEETLLKFAKNIDWEQACISQNLSCEFIDKYYIKLRLYLYEIAKYQKLSEDFMRKHKNDLDWDLISEYQNLSESFIEEMSDYVNWTWISEKQKLSKEFIVRNSDKLNIVRLLQRKISLPTELKNSDYVKIYKIYTNKNRINVEVG